MPKSLLPAVFTRSPNFAACQAKEAAPPRVCFPCPPLAVCFCRPGVPPRESHCWGCWGWPTVAPQLPAQPSWPPQRLMARPSPLQVHSPADAGLRHAHHRHPTPRHRAPLWQAGDGALRPKHVSWKRHWAPNTAGSPLVEPYEVGTGLGAEHCVCRGRVWHRVGLAPRVPLLGAGMAVTADTDCSSCVPAKETSARTKEREGSQEAHYQEAPERFHVVYERDAGKSHR